MDKIKSGIDNYLNPILITVIGFLMITTLMQIKKDIQKLNDRNLARDEWVREWTEEWQPVLYWARRKMNNED